MQHMLVLRRVVCPGAARIPDVWTRSFGLVEFAGQWPPSEQRQFESDMRVIRDFITAPEEQLLMREIEPHISRLPYESSHWDEAIHGYRELERRKWSPENRAMLERVSQAAFCGQVMPFVHILDLAVSGVIKPHVDSTRVSWTMEDARRFHSHLPICTRQFCGNTIAGISLLSDCVMRLKRVTKDLDSVGHSADLLLPRRSLYIMSALARYEFTHEILARDQSWFKKRLVERSRRISVICRNEP
ncbi:alpha-ketoglutarate-dependent dioxygenase alkB homolog 7, mitochondrial-like isoform X1 [Drosophila santomea]|uniref:alpha-ketoglutarate-dependent dioxygenase alkB homolog 7, mitochondrial-like isoform X1 n=1 Tax=Drosophila santomea TaxID=129105 RepID=UPI001954A5A6|nr:alpha-ketoglutarate-dependent dioxygenase alkB homolog 7, mitochondrial-like isoform X1 [Drosophila santomea]